MIEDRKRLLKRYHTLCSVKGLTAEDKDAILSGYGVSSSTELSIVELWQIIDRLEGNDRPKGCTPDKFEELDKWRKRVIASIGKHLTNSGYVNSIGTIKAIACRITGHGKGFNAIPIERLRNIYNTFLNKQRDSSEAKDVLTEMESWLVELAEKKGVS